jgi:hypothetical protein
MGKVMVAAEPTPTVVVYLAEKAVAEPKKKKPAPK